MGVAVERCRETQLDVGEPEDWTEELNYLHFAHPPRPLDQKRGRLEVAR